MDVELIAKPRNRWSIAINSIAFVTMGILALIRSLEIKNRKNRFLIATEMFIMMLPSSAIMLYWIIRIWKIKLKECSGKTTRILYWFAMAFCILIFLCFHTTMILIITKKEEVVEATLGDGFSIIALLYIMISSLGLLPRPLHINRRVETWIHVLIQIAMVGSTAMKYRLGLENIQPYTFLACGLILSAFSLLKDIFLSQKWSYWKKYDLRYDWVPLATLVISISISCYFWNDEKETQNTGRT